MDVMFSKFLSKTRIIFQVKVWWVDGHISMCWPQDLYKCGEYDSEDGELWEETNSEASWETESEDTVAGEGYVFLFPFNLLYCFA